MISRILFTPFAIILSVLGIIELIIRDILILPAFIFIGKNCTKLLDRVWLWESIDTLYELMLGNEEDDDEFETIGCD